MEKTSLRDQLPEMDDTAAAIAAGMRIGELEAVKTLEFYGVPHIVIPAGMELKSMEAFAERPPRQSFSRIFGDPESFCKFAEEMDAKNTARLYGDFTNYSIQAIFADVQPGVSSWEVQRAKLELQLSPELIQWKSMQGKLISQLEFVEFLEEMIHTIAQPDGSVITDAYRTLQASHNTKVTQVMREGGDLQVEIQEEVRGTVRDSSVSIPSRLTLALRVFEMGKVYPFDVMVTYRLHDSAVKFSLKLLQLPETREQAFLDVRAQVEEELGMTVLF